MPFRISVNTAGLTDPEHVAVFDNAGDPSKGGVEIRFEDLSQNDPAGRFRIRLLEETFTLDQSIEPEWADWISLLTLEGQEVTLTLPDDDVAEALAVLLMEVTELREYAALACG